MLNVVVYKWGGGGGGGRGGGEGGREGGRERERIPYNLVDIQSAVSKEHTFSRTCNPEPFYSRPYGFKTVGWDN